MKKQNFVKLEGFVTECDAYNRLKLTYHGDTENKLQMLNLQYGSPGGWSPAFRNIFIVKPPRSNTPLTHWVGNYVSLECKPKRYDGGWTLVLINIKLLVPQQSDFPGRVPSPDETSGLIK